jgi:hypothetical protein
MGESSATELQRKLMAECDRFLEERAHEYGHARKFFELDVKILAERIVARLTGGSPLQHAADTQQKERHPCRAGAETQFGDEPACNLCGSLMTRSGTCYRCATCGSTSGCS